MVNLDKLTYAGNVGSLSSLQGDARHVFVRGDIGDQPLVDSLLQKHCPRAVINFAAESHVDRSIHGAGEFIQTNLVGTYRLLEAVRGYWTALPADESERFRFLHVSTDEVYGSLGAGEPGFRETTAYSPNSPYSASKAGSDHLVRAWHHTYGLPTLITNCSNNYGPLQFPEKLIPLMILNGVQGKPLPVYGDGRNVRDWLYVTDHCAALREVLARGRPGEVYNIGGESERHEYRRRRDRLRVARRNAASVIEPAAPPAHYVREGPSGARPALRGGLFQDSRRAGLAPWRDVRGRLAAHGAVVPGQRRVG